MERGTFTYAQPQSKRREKGGLARGSDWARSAVPRKSEVEAQREGVLTAFEEGDPGVKQRRARKALHAANSLFVSERRRGRTVFAARLDAGGWTKRGRRLWSPSLRLRRSRLGGLGSLPPN